MFDAGKLAERNVTYYTPFSSVDIARFLSVMADMHATQTAFQTPWTRNGLTYLGGGVGSSDYVLLTKAPITTMADLAGLRLGVAGHSATWLDGTGAVGVSGNLTTYYNEIKKGVYDGVIVFASAAVGTLAIARKHAYSCW